MKQIEITKENYKKYIKYLTEEKKISEKITSAWSSLIGTILYLPFCFLILLVEMPVIAVLIFAISGMVLGKSIYQITKGNSKYKKLNEKYLNGQDFGVSEIEYALKEAGILRYDHLTDLEFYDEKGFENYCDCEQVKKEMSNEPIKTFRYPGHSIPENELQKVKVKVKR